MGRLRLSSRLWGERMDLTKNNLVTRKSYNHDLLFRIANIKNNIASLYGEDMRLEADAPLEDLRRVEDRELETRRKK